MQRLNAVTRGVVAGSLTLTEMRFVKMHRSTGGAVTSCVGQGWSEGDLGPKGRRLIDMDEQLLESWAED